MSETDPRFNAIEVKKTDEKMEVLEKEERSDWVGSHTAIDKIGKAMETLEQDPASFILPTGMTLDDIKNWVPRAAHTLNKNKVFERKEGRTGLEQWAYPANYATIEGSMGRGMMLQDQVDSSIYRDNNINVAGMIYDEISIHGRATLDEICRNIGSIPEQMLTVVVNSLLKDKFLVPYVESDGVKTLELVEAHIRNNMLGLTPDPVPELEDKESDRNIGGTPDKPEDVVTTYEFEEGTNEDCESRGHDPWNCPDLMTKEPPKFKSKIKDSHFEQ